MSPTVLILKNNLPIFHRSYGEKSIENIDLTAGFFQAILEFAGKDGARRLDGINLSEFTFYFRTINDYTFVLRQDATAPKTKEEVGVLLDELSFRFFKELPDIDNWDGNTKYFEKFGITCDDIFSESFARRGFPLLLRLFLKTFSTALVTEVVPKTPQAEKYFDELDGILAGLMEQWSDKGFKEMFKQPELLYMPTNQSLAYIYPFNQRLKGKEITHLLCFIVEEGDWYAFYQVIPSINQKGQQILPDLAKFIEEISRDFSSGEITQQEKYMQGSIKDWADLNQYYSGIQASIYEAFVKAGISRENLTENRVKENFKNLLNIVGDEADKVLNAILGLHQVLFVGRDRSLVESMLSALLAFYPSPSVTLWAEKPSSSLLVGALPEAMKRYQKSTVIVDLDKKLISGGMKNAFCATVLQETKESLEGMSVNDAHFLFQSKILSMFTILKMLLYAASLDKTSQHEQYREILSHYPSSVIQTLILMSENFNQLLARNIESFLHT